MSTTDNMVKSLTGVYTIDKSHSQIGFNVRHAVVAKVRGTFKEFSGTGFFDIDEPSNSNLEVNINVASIDTANVDRDNHLKSDDFFSVSSYPTITLKSTSIKENGEASYLVTADLTIRDTIKSITFDLEYLGDSVDPYGNQRIGLEGVFSINRIDYGIVWNTALETGGVLVSDKVNIEFEISAIQAK